jgi:hypothetical protein
MIRGIVSREPGSPSTNRLSGGRKSHRLKKHRIGALLILFLSNLNGSDIASAGIAPDAEDLLSKAIKVQEADAKWNVASGHGTIHYLKSDLTEDATWDVVFRMNESKLFGAYQLRREESIINAVNDYDSFRLLADGKIIVNAVFSPRIHPSGCQGSSYDDVQEMFPMAAKGTNFDLRMTLSPPLLRSTEVLETYKGPDAEVVVDPDRKDSGLIIRYKGLSFWKIRLDPDLDFRITRAELGMQNEPDKPSRIYQYSWKRLVGSCQPEKITLYLLDLKSKLNYHTFEFKLDGLKSLDADNHEVVDSQFTLRELQLVGRSILNDRRKTTPFKIRNVIPDFPPPDSNELSLTDCVEKFPPR